MASGSSDIDVALEELEARLERLRALYEQYFIGIEKIEPSVPRQDVDRRIYALRKVQIRNTAKRFKLQTIIQRYNAFQQYWLRICREIENGTYHRHVARAQSRFGDVPLTAAARRRARLQGPSQTDEQKAAVEEKAKARKETDDDLEALLGEDLDVALSRALLAADDVEITRVDSGPPRPVRVSPEAVPSKVQSVAAPPRGGPEAEAAGSAKPLPPKPPPRTRPGVVAKSEATPGAAPPVGAATLVAPTASSNPAAGESAPAPRAAPPIRKAAAQAPAAATQAPAPIPAVKGSGGAARPVPAAPAAAAAAAAVGAGAPAVAAGIAPKPLGAPRVVAAAPSASEGAGTNPVLAREAGAPKAKPAAPAPKAPQPADGWAALRIPAAQRQGPAAAPSRSEPAAADAKARRPAAPPAQATAVSGAAESKKAEPKPVPSELAPRPPAARVRTATPSPQASGEPAAVPLADARAAAAGRRAAAEKAAETRSQARAAPQAAGMDDQRLSQLHGALVAERRRLNQPGKVSKDALAASLRDTESKLRKQYGDKQIDFHVVVKDGKAVVKPIVG